jgi:hypothetical protein
MTATIKQTKTTKLTEDDLIIIRTALLLRIGRGDTSNETFATLKKIEDLVERAQKAARA